MTTHLHPHSDEYWTQNDAQYAADSASTTTATRAAQHAAAYRAEQTRAAARAPRKSVSDRLYRSTHGRAPRGYGRWMFELRNLPGQPPTDMVTERTGTYTEAKRSLTAGEWIVLP